jgi:hypothetical protein
MKWHQFERWGMHNLQYGSAPRKAKTIGTAALIAASAAAGVVGIVSLLGKVAQNGGQRKS